MALIQTSDLSQRIDFIKDTTVKDEDGQLVTTPETVFFHVGLVFKHNA